MAFDMKLTVVMADGRELEVSADQRDWAAMEILELPAAAPIARTRALAWSALKRAGHYNGRWDRFAEHDCVMVTEVEVPDPEADADEVAAVAAGVGDDDETPAVYDPNAPEVATDADPKAGRPARGAASTSSSPTRRAARSKK
jgi:hypothetical protein